MHIYIYIYIYVHIHIYIHVHMYYVYLHIYIYACMYFAGSHWEQRQMLTEFMCAAPSGDTCFTRLIHSYDLTQACV